MIRTYSAAVKFLDEFVPSPREKFLGPLAIHRMQYLVKIMGNPQFSYYTIHVGGTSGKGSTTTIISNLLSTIYNVGTNLSPHLENVTERMGINGVDISRDDFVELINELIPFIKKMKMSKFGKPSTFEITTAGAFLYFKKMKVDVAVMEVGLGGRYDGTNVINPQVSVLTNIGLDHTEVLGDTVEKIALEKAGIIKKGRLAVSAVKQPSVIRIVEKACKENGSRLYLLGRDFSYKVKKLSDKGSVFDYFGEVTYRNLKLSLLGEHQIENAALALRSMECMNLPSGKAGVRMHGQKITEKDIRKGLIEAFIPGRMEIVRRKPLIMFDGAHNPDKMKALVNSVKKIFPKKKVIGVLAIKKDKDARGMIEYLLPICDRVVLTKFKLTTDVGETYSYDAKDLYNMAKQLDPDQNLKIINEPLMAVGEAIKKAQKEDLILITGSLYLVGEVRKYFK